MAVLLEFGTAEGFFQLKGSSYLHCRIMHAVNQRDCLTLSLDFLIENVFSREQNLIVTYNVLYHLQISLIINFIGLGDNIYILTIIHMNVV